MRTTDNEKAMQKELEQLDPRRIALIQKLYYQAMDALPQLAEELSFADMELRGGHGALFEAQLVALKAIKTLKETGLGRHL